MGASGISGEVGGKAVSTLMEENQGIHHLNVADNNSSSESFDAFDGPLFFQEIAHGLSHNMTLVSLDVSGNGLGELQLPEGWTMCARHVCNELLDTSLKAGAARMRSIRQGFGPLDVQPLDAGEPSAEDEEKKEPLLELEGAVKDGWAGGGDSDDDIILSSDDDEHGEIEDGAREEEDGAAPRRALFAATSPARLVGGAPGVQQLLSASLPARLDALAATSVAASSYKYTHNDGRKQNDPPGGAKQGGLIALAAAIVDHPTLTKLNISRNAIGGLAGHKNGLLALSEALKVNLAIKELDVSSNGIDSQDVRIMASGLLANDTLSALHIGSNCIPKDAMYQLMCVVWRKENIRSLCDVPIKDTTVVELDVSRHDLGTEGANAAMWYTSINDRLLKIDIRYNGIPRETQRELEEICAAKTIVMAR
jgi:hypothetical protein